ncbi:hypothetical protein [Brevibacillus agri]|uniref:hypothetical protein n=1 Tax=Brevibacillus agri TaxID=51101 RepID=UPI002867C0A7|nr:hypothetical protein [Brevibacillus agri]
MNYINHVTLNTGHVRKTYPEEVDKSIYFVLQRILKDSINPGGAELFDGYKVVSSREGSIAIATVIASDGAPVLTTLVSERSNQVIWKQLHETSTLPLVTKANTEPISPYIADRIEVGAAIHLDATKWTGDFSRCFGWIILCPSAVR